MMLVRTSRWLVVAAIATSSASSRAEPATAAFPATLDLKQAIDLFRTNGLDLLIAEAAITSADGDVTIAGAIPNPALSVSYGAISFFYSCTQAAGCPRPPASISVGISDQAAIEDTLSGKRRMRVEVANAALAAARLGKDDVDRNLVFQVKAQFEQVLIAQEEFKFAKKTAEANATMLDKAEKQREAEKTQRPDLLRVKVAKLESDQSADLALQTLRKARMQLAFLLGVRTAVPDFTVVQPELQSYGPSPKLAALDHDALLATALASRADLRAQLALVASAEAQRRLASRERFPDIAVSLGYTQQGTTDQAASPPTVSIGLSAPIPVLYQQQGEIRKADANLRAQRLQADKLKATIVRDFEVAYADYLASQTLVQRMTDGTLLASADQAVADVQLLYEKGGAQLVDYLLALSTDIATNVEYLDDVANYWTAVFELEQATGTELR